MAKKYIVELDNGLIQKTNRCSSKNTMLFVEALCSALMRKPLRDVVPVFSFTRIREGYYDYEYRYTMQKLNKLSSFEKMYLYARSGIDDMQDIFPDYKRKYSPEESKAILERGRRDLSELENFVLSVEKRYFDIHPGNIMKDDEGNYRLIDLEGFYCVMPLEQPENDWFMKQ